MRKKQTTSKTSDYISKEMETLRKNKKERLEKKHTTIT